MGAISFSFPLNCSLMSSIKTKGLGGSETYIIRMAETMVNLYPQYSIVVMCNCGINRVYNGVTYHDIYDFPRIS